MAKNKRYNQFTYCQIQLGYAYMVQELKQANAPDWLWFLFNKAWEDFKKNKWKYDGATFVPERSASTLFEVASFIHDYLNAKGYVGVLVDYLFVEIMLLLNYTVDIVLRNRTSKLKFTVFNVWRRKLWNVFKKGKYTGDIDILAIKKHNILRTI